VDDLGVVSRMGNVWREVVIRGDCEQRGGQMMEVVNGGIWGVAELANV